MIFGVCFVKADGSGVLIITTVGLWVGIHGSVCVCVCRDTTVLLVFVCVVLVCLSICVYWLVFVIWYSSVCNSEKNLQNLPKKPKNQCRRSKKLEPKKQISGLSNVRVGCIHETLRHIITTTSYMLCCCKEPTTRTFHIFYKIRVFNHKPLYYVSTHSRSPRVVSSTRSSHTLYVYIITHIHHI